MSEKAKRPDQQAEAFHSRFIAETETKHTTLAGAATALADSGLGIPLPLPHGKKSPPPAGCTGRYDGPTLTTAVVAVADSEGNVGLRLSDSVLVDGVRYGVIGLDVDEYDEKHGADTFREVDEATPLPPTWRSTRRGADNPSGIRLYLAPAGLAWPNQAGDDIEIIRHGHRYAVVAPSVVDGMSYEWFDADDNPCAAPRAVELPLLPIEFVERLTSDRAAVEHRTPETPIDAGEGESWLAEVMPFFDDSMSDYLAAVTAPLTLADAMSGGAHDEALARVHHAVQLAAEGHHGLGSALALIWDAFTGEFAERRASGHTARTEDELRGEWRRIVDGAANNLRGDLDAELLVLLEASGHAAGDSSAIDVTATFQRFGDTAQHALDEGDDVDLIDATQYPDNDTGRARILLDMLGHRLIAISDMADTFAVYLRGRWHTVTAGQIHAALWADTVTASLNATAGRLFDEADEADGDKDAAEIRKRATAMAVRATRSGDETAMVRGTRHAWKACGNRRALMEFDSAPITFGAENGIIDIAAYVESRDVSDLVRLPRPGDYVTRSVGYAFDPRAVSKRVEQFLALFVPDLELRRDLFRVLGSMIVTGNPKRHFVAVLGGTSTGKSTLIHWLTRALGSVSTAHASGDVAARPGYVAAGSVDLFGGSSGPNPELLDALRSRIFTMSEANSRVVFHGDTLKMLTGGDEIATRFLYSNNVVRSIPQFTPLLVTNQLPTITGADEAVFRRLIVIPFDRAHRGLVDDGKFTDADCSHFLRLVIDGYLDGLDNKWVEACDLCEAIAVATETACGELDPLRSWIDETFVKASDASVDERVGATEAWLAWQVHEMAEQVPAGERPTRRQLEQRMTERYGKPSPRRRTDGSRKRVYPLPIVLRDDDCPAEDGTRRLSIRRLSGDR